MKQEHRGNGDIVLLNIAFPEFRGSGLLCGDAKPEIKQKRVAEEGPQHHPEAVVRFSKLRNHPAGDEHALNQAHSHAEIIGERIFQKRDFQSASSLSPSARRFIRR